MKKVLWCLLGMMVSTQAQATMAVKPEHYSHLRDVINLKGFECKTVDVGYAEEKAYIGGVIFKVYCDDSFVYRVISGGKSLCAEPWDSKPQQCK